MLDNGPPQESIINADSLIEINPTVIRLNDTILIKDVVDFKAFSAHDEDIAVFQYQIGAVSGIDTNWYDMDMDPPGDFNGDNQPGRGDRDDDNDGLINEGSIFDDDEDGNIDEDEYFSFASNEFYKSYGYITTINEW